MLGTKKRLGIERSAPNRRGPPAAVDGERGEVHVRALREVEETHCELLAVRSAAHEAYECVEVGRRHSAH